MATKTVTGTAKKKPAGKSPTKVKAALKKTGTKTATKKRAKKT